MRVSIKPHLKHYFELLQQQMECDNPSEVLNYLLMDLKLKGYSFLADYEYIPQVPQPTTTKTEPLHQDDIVQNEDPVIKRLSALLEDF